MNHHIHVHQIIIIKLAIYKGIMLSNDSQMLNTACNCSSKCQISLHKYIKRYNYTKTQCQRHTRPFS